jgi:ubiquinone/menaquinone biosynthesis C-methylase UbiE
LNSWKELRISDYIPKDCEENVLQISDKERWEMLSEYWHQRMGRDGDWYYRTVLQPSLISLLGNIHGLNILDAGCSTGSISRFLARQGAYVVGVDYSERMIRLASDENKKEPLSIQYECFDIEKVNSFLKKRFHVIIADFILQDVKNYDIILQELSRLLVDGGRLVVILEHPFFCIFDEVHVTTKRVWDDFAGKDHPSILLRYIKGRTSKIFWTKDLWTCTYHHQLEEYLESFRKVGLSVSDIKEPIVANAAALSGPKGNLSSEVPMFMLIQTVKLPYKKC